MKKRGFTLIELMIVVAIIGILAAIAIPDFLKFQAKARQSEAKTNLASIATAEISYFAEKNEWGPDFFVIGWSPTGQTRYRYNLATPGVSGTSMLGEDDTAGHQPGCNNAVTACINDCAANGTPPAGVNPTVGFTAWAEGNIDGDADIDDCWYILSDKTPRNPPAFNDVNMGG